MIKVLVFAESAVVRSGLESLVKSQGIEAAASGPWREAGSLSASLPADVLIADWPDAEAAINTYPTGPVAPAIILTTDQARGWILEAIRLGVRAILPETTSGPELRAAISAVFEGLAVVSPQLLTDLGTPKPRPGNQPLSPRELNVLKRLAAGEPNKVIAYELNISEHTVKFHLNSLFNKLNVSTRAEAVAVGMRQGVIPL